MRSYQVLEVNKDLGGGDLRESLLVSRDDLLQLNLVSVKFPRLTFVSGRRNKTMRNSLEKLLLEYKDFFAWNYTKMSGLDREFVEQ